MADSRLYRELAAVRGQVQRALGTLVSGILRPDSDAVRVEFRLQGADGVRVGADRLEQQPMLTATFYDPDLVVGIRDRLQVGTLTYEVTRRQGLRADQQATPYVTRVGLVEV